VGPQALRPPNPVRLLEYDTRFTVYGPDYSPYDYRRPLDLPPTLAAHSAAVVLADPPYLSDECFSKTATTVRHLAADGACVLVCTGARAFAPARPLTWLEGAVGRGRSYAGWCTGAVMAATVQRHLGLRMCAFRPGHANKLSNEFRCYANVDDPVLGRDPSPPTAEDSAPA
jgi:EEF1A lysine methyltransferase 1